MILICIALAVELPDDLPPGYEKLVTGVGKINAALALTQKLAQRTDITQVINYGTAGGFEQHHKGQLLSVSQVLERDMDCTALGLAAYVTFGETQVLINTANANGVICGTGDSFGPASGDYDIVEMEAYALAKVCAAMQLPFYCYKYISDISSDGDASDQWQDNVHKGTQAFMAVLA